MLDKNLQPLDYDQQQLLLYIQKGNNQRRLKKPIYKKWLHLLFTNDMGKYVHTDEYFMYITDAGKVALAEVACGRRGITISVDRSKELLKKGILVRGNQGLEWAGYHTWKYQYGDNP